MTESGAPIPIARSRSSGPAPLGSQALPRSPPLIANRSTPRSKLMALKKNSKTQDVPQTQQQQAETS